MTVTDTTICAAGSGIADARGPAWGILALRAIDVALKDLVAAQTDAVLGGTVLHPWTGLEVLSIGFAAARRDGDIVFATHRGVGHCLAWGADPRRTLAETLGRESGFGLGRGGHMHIVHPASGIGGTNGIVGGGIPLGVGAALAVQVAERPNVVTVFIGDGATNTGSFHESLNLAAVWNLPLVVVCEDNGITEAMRSEAQRAAPSLVARGRSYALPSVEVDGDDLPAIHRAASEAYELARGGGGPSFVCCRVSRPGGHYVGDRQHYRSSDDAERAVREDPVPRALAQLDLPAAEASRLAEEAKRYAERLLRDVLADAPPSRAQLMVGADGHGATEAVPVNPAPRKYWQAVNQALEAEMSRDPSVVLFGQNVAESGGTFGSTRGLLERFGPARVRDTPISEQAAVGAAVGAAMFGLRPVIEIVFSDFLFIALDQVVNQAAKCGYFAGGSAELPMVIKTGVGVGFGMGAQHSQSLEAWYAHVPGLKVVWGGTPGDAGELLKAAIRDPGPVVFLESVARYTERGPVPDGEPAPIGRARIAREGADVTVIAYGTAVSTCLEAAEELALAGVECEVIDLRSIQPWDVEAVVSSVRRTRRAVVVHDAVRTFGVGAEIASEIGERCFGRLLAPVLRVGSPRVPMPQVRQFETAVLPAAADVVDAVRRTRPEAS